MNAMLKKVIKFNAGDFAAIAAIAAGIFLILQLIINIVMLAVEPDTVPAICGILVPVILGFILLIFFMSNLVINFDFLLRSGVTRRSALGSMLVLMVLEAAEAAVLSLLLGKADLLIARAWAAARPVLTVEEFFSPPAWGIALGYLAVLVLALVSGAALQRFGRRAFWVMWGGWMVLVVLMNSQDWWEALFDGAVLAGAASAPIAALVLTGTAVLAAVAWSVHTLLRATVKN